MVKIVLTLKKKKNRADTVTFSVSIHCLVLCVYISGLLRVNEYLHNEFYIALGSSLNRSFSNT